MPTRRAAAGRWARSAQALRVWAVVSVLLIGLVFVQSRRDRAQERKAAAQRVAIERQARLDADKARDDARRQANAQFAFAINSISCGFLSIADTQIKSLDGQIRRAHAAAVDPSSSPELKARNAAAEAAARRTRALAIKFRRNVPVTVPPTYDCRNLKRDSNTKPKGDQ